jgi:Zn-dependent protease
VLLYEPEPTPYDLRWRAFGTDFRVHPGFWIMSIILGWPPDWAGKHALAGLLIWVACVFVSILVHEMGHILMGRLFGSRGHVILYTFGGLAVGSNTIRHPWKRIAVSFAGPLAGFILALVIGLVGIGLAIQGAEAHPLVEAAFFDLLQINLAWGILNLFPIWPLDGGQISRDFLGWLFPTNGARVAYVISLVVAGLLAALCLYLGMPFNGIFFAVLALGSYQALQAENSRPRWERNEETSPVPWERDADWWKR